MPEEENKKLRDLVSETLQTKGVLGRIQAEIRASVFLALEEQDVFKDKSPFINRQLKDFLKSSDGVAVISLVREFLEFFNLEFSAMVFDPETHAGLDYNYEGRSKLANVLNINDNDKHQPLLVQIFKTSKTFQNNQTDKEDVLTKEPLLNRNIKTAIETNEMSNIRINFPEDVTIPSPHTTNKVIKEKLNSNNFTSDSVKSNLDLNNKVDENLHEKGKKELGVASLTSLGNLPPIGKNSQPEIKDKKESYDLKALLDLETEKQYDDDFLSSGSEHPKKSSKVDSISEGSEIEEEISEISNLSAQQDENTLDITISKASGHGDYLENV